MPKSPVIVEAGAHNGMDSIRMSKVWPNAMIYSFEPLPAIFEILKKRVGNKNNVKIYPIALSDKCGVQELNISSGRSDASSSLLPPLEHLKVHPDVHFQEKIIVQTLTLDEFVQKENLVKVDFIWLDIQGMELQVLKSGMKTLKNIQCIFLEVNFIENYNGCHLFNEVKEWLGLQGFSLEYLDSRYKDAGNALFVRHYK